MTTFDTDPNTQTVAAGWSSSPLGNPDHDFFLDDPDEPTTATVPQADRRRPIPRYAFLVGALGVAIAGLAFTLISTGLTPDEAAVEPGPTQPAVVLTPHSQVLPSAPVPAAVTPAPDTARVATQPSAPAQGTVVDVPTPQAPAPDDPAPQVPAPADPGPQDPAPEPPVLDDLPFDLPEPPKPEPPVFDPDLPLAPAPAPDPEAVPLPDFDLKAGPNP